MKATAQDRARLERESARLIEQLRAMGAVKIILFGSLAQGEISLFSDIDLLVLDDDRPGASGDGFSWGAPQFPWRGADCFTGR